MSWSPRRSLVARLVSAYLAVSLAVAACVGLAAYLAGRELLRDAALVRLDAASRQKETDLALWVEERLRGLRYLGSAIPPQDLLGVPGRAQELTRRMQAFKEAQPDIQEVLVLAPSGGRVLLSTDPAHVGDYRAGYNYYVQGRLGPSVQSVYLSPDSLRPVLTVSMPLKDAAGELLAVLAMHLGLEPIDLIIRSRAGLGETGETFLVDASNILVATGRLGGPPRPRQAHTDGILRALAGESGSGLYLNDSGVPVLGVYRWLPGYQMALLSEMSQAEAFAPAGRLALLIVLAGIAAGICLGVGVFVLSRRVARPVLEVTQAATAVAGGDLSVRAQVETRDELGNLAKAFNAMTADLSALYSRLRQEGRERGAILQASFDGIAVADADGAIEFLNPGMERIFGHPAAELPSLAALADRIHPRREQRQAFVASLAADMDRPEPPVRVFSFQHQGGGVRWCRMKVSRMPGGRVVINAQDVTELKSAEERVRHLALHDPLTGLPNRQLFADRLDQALRRARRLERHVGLLYVDLDGFKGLNDAYGHAHGDRVLVETSLRLRAAVRESDTVARLGGDEFVVILPDLVQTEDALPVAEKIRGALYQPKLAGGSMFLGASLGLAGFPEHGSDQDALLNRADAAMYAAKRAGGNRVSVAGGAPAEAGETQA